MNIRLEQLNPIIGDIQGNKEKILSRIESAKADQVDLVIFPELVTCGYPPMDLLERNDFLERIYESNQDIILASDGIKVIFGTITENASGIGRPIYNAALIAEGGELVFETHKTLLPTYDIFDDYRYFEPNTEFKTWDCEGVKFGISICEDIWFNDNEIQYHQYDVNPVKELSAIGAEIIVNVSASPYSRNKLTSRTEMLRAHAMEFNKVVLYVNQTGANTEIIFDGDTMAIQPDGTVIARAQVFQEDHIDLLLDTSKHTIQAIGEHPVAEQMPREEQMFKALVLGLRDYLGKTKLTNEVLLGLSGGIDSAMVSVIAAEALGAENVHAITMPSVFSSEGSVTDSEKLADNLGIHLNEIAIQPIVDQFTEALDPLFKGTEFGVAEENIQSRIRGNLLMAISNKFGYMLLNTGNKSEYAVGYCTLYGDMSGGLALLSDVYKTEIYSIANWLNESYYEREVIPRSIIDKAPSAELRPDQKDTDSLPDYDTLDKILYYYIEEQWSMEQISNLGIDQDIIYKVLRLVDYSEHKRFQAAPGLRVSGKAFGSGRRWPIVQGWTRQHVKSFIKE